MVKRTLFFLIFFSIMFFLNSCKVWTAYLPESPLPPSTELPETPKLEVVTMPPVYIPENQYRTMSRPVAQYFEIAIPPCVDMTGNSEYLINSLADMFYTALFNVKRFKLMDRMELSRVQIDVNDKFTAYSDSLKLLGLLTQQEMKKLENEKYKEVLKALQDKTDGVLLIYITSNSKTDSGNVAYIDYRIVNRNNEVLFAGSKDIKYTYDKNRGSLNLNRADIDSVAQDILHSFPNPSFQEGYKIIDKKGDFITVNMGKKQNVSKGMVGYVIKITKNSYGNKIISYRAEFIVTEVFEDTFRALLVPKTDEEKMLIKTIHIGEPIKMK